MKFYTFGKRENPAILLLPGTQVHIFYAVKMGGKYEARYRKHFLNPDIRCQDLQHEELLAVSKANYERKGPFGFRK